MTPQKARRMPRLKWHRLRRRLADPVFQRARLEEGLVAGAAIEVDLVLTRDGHFVCLHDLTLDRETTGHGPVRAMARAEVEKLRQRAEDGTPLTDPPLFLDEIVAACRRHGIAEGGRLQLDMKQPADDIAPAELAALGRLLAGTAPAFIAGGTEWPLILAMAEAAPGLHRGFDPLDWHEHALPADADGFRALGARTLAEAPGASLYYLMADLVLAGLDHGVDLIGMVAARGAEVDSWTIDTDRPNLRTDLGRLLDAGCHQITTNEPEALEPVLRELVG